MAHISQHTRRAIRSATAAAGRTGRKPAVPVALPALLALLSAGAADAQTRSIAEELRLNVHAGVVRHGSSTSAAPGLSAGYGTSRWFVPFMTFHRATVQDDGEEFRLRHLDAGVRVHVRGSSARVVPFVLGGLTWRSASWVDRPFLGDTLDVRIAGSGPTLGGGVLYYLAPRIALETSVKWTRGEMTQATVRGSHFDAGEASLRERSLRLNLGVSWFPVRARPRTR